MKLVIRMWHSNPVLVTAVVLLMVVSTSAQLTIIATRAALDNNRISLACRDSNGIDTTATFYRRVPHDGRELLINPLGPIADISAIISTICFRCHNLCKKCQNLTKFSHIEEYKKPLKNQ